MGVEVDIQCNPCITVIRYQTGLPVQTASIRDCNCCCILLTCESLLRVQIGSVMGMSVSVGLLWAAYPIAATPQALGRDLLVLQCTPVADLTCSTVMDMTCCLLRADRERDGHVCVGGPAAGNIPRSGHA